MGFVAHNEEVVLLYSVFGSAPEMGQLTDGVRKTAGANMNEGNISYVCPCPWLASANFSPLRFMPDLCDAGDVAVSFLSALQDSKQRGRNLYKTSPALCLYIYNT